mmetsp:Transcript_8582/g.30759  ORF Transcript_8582/g.30759 Transcript_8582/m.30759 type:complete len:96 (+) Transcript_8582:1798-2085(+)
MFLPFNVSVVAAQPGKGGEHTCALDAGINRSERLRALLVCVEIRATGRLKYRTSLKVGVRCFAQYSPGLQSIVMWFVAQVSRSPVHTSRINAVRV